MAARVVAQHAEAFQQRRHLRIPHRQAGAERVGHDQHRRAGRALEFVVQAQPVAGGNAHDAGLAQRIEEGCGASGVTAIFMYGNSGRADKRLCSASFDSTSNTL
ncbi:hypothetical protein D3C81_1207540 [compost metagenome]